MTAYQFYLITAEFEGHVEFPSLESAKAAKAAMSKAYGYENAGAIVAIHADGFDEEVAA